jgi:hypothetical protein
VPERQHAPGCTEPSDHPFVCLTATDEPELTDAERERFARRELRDMVEQLTDEAIASVERKVAAQEAARQEAAAVLYGTPDSAAAPGRPGDAHLAWVARALEIIAARLPVDGDVGPLDELRSIAAMLREP